MPSTFIRPNIKGCDVEKAKKWRKYGKAITKEVGKLLKAELVQEIKYPTWISNMVMVKKKSGIWNICMDFIDLNKECPKDSYSLPHIDRLIDVASGFRLLIFMDT